MKFLLSLIILIANTAEAKPSKKYIQESFEKAAKQVGVPALLLEAICAAESNQRPEAFNFQDGHSTNHAFGMCQVLYETALELGSPKDENCLRDFRTKKQQKKAGIENPIVIERNYKTCKLFGPFTNALYAAKYLARKLKLYDNSWISAIASYNTGILKTCTTGKVHDSKGNLLYTCKKGGLLNQRYVDRVMDYMAKIRAAKIKELTK